MSLTLSISGIAKEYKGRRVLDDCTFSFDHGNIFALMGPNGCGKSTLLRICALLDHASTGAVTYASGTDILPHDVPLRRRFTLVLSKVGLFNTTVFKNAAYGLKLRGLPGKVIEQKAAMALDAVGLTHKKNQHALTLSSGESQRLGLARAMAIEPEILFLDEPTASIDEKNTRIVEDIILGLRKSGRTTIIMSTHDKEQAARLADRVVRIHDGRIACQP